ncbi:MAG: DUF1015 domain-containing protein, partial [Deltaproteobacteria bacterium]|nr:DUF1015 domain-containing protein [Deltaproteobacteria bacterium]
MSSNPERIAPFAALTFNSARTGPLKQIVAPPYDLIDKSRQDELYARSPYNVVRLELNRDADPYAAAAATLAEWIDAKVIAPVSRPAIYFYTQTFKVEGRQLVRSGLIARIRLDEFKDGRILPHERTFPKAKEDRLRLLTETHTNVSPIFGLYPSGNTALESLLAEVAERAPMIEVTDDLGILNQVRAIEDRDEIAIVQNSLADVRVLIADGHHRYETALEYRRRRRAEEGNPAGVRGYDYVMMTLVAFNDPGLVILPTHRLVRHLPADAIAVFDTLASEIFELIEVASVDAMRTAIAGDGSGTIGVALKGRQQLLALRLKNRDALASAMPDVPVAVRELDVSILHTLVLERIFGIKPDEVRRGGNIEYTIDA